MVTVGLVVRLDGKARQGGRGDQLLEGGLALVEEEPATIAWFAIRLGPSEFGIFDAFPTTRAGKPTSGARGAALMAQAPSSGAAAGDRASRRSRGQAARLTAAG